VTSATWHSGFAVAQTNRTIIMQSEKRTIAWITVLFTGALVTTYAIWRRQTRCTGIMMIKNRKANSSVLWPTVTQFHPRTRNNADSKTEQPLFIAVIPSTAGICLRHELFTAGGLRCKSGAGELTLDTGAHCCTFRTHAILARWWWWHVRSKRSTTTWRNVAYSLQLSCRVSRRSAAQQRLTSALGRRGKSGIATHCVINLTL